MTLRVVIADEDALAREKLRTLTAGIADVQVVGEAEDGPGALRLIEELRPDLVLLGLAMPGFGGLEVVRRVRHRPAIVFTTAFDPGAVAALELQAVDYLVKPFDPERFEMTIAQARERSRSAGPGDAERLRHAVYENGHLSRLFVRDRNRILVVPTTEIERLEARGDYVALHVGTRRHLVHVAIADMERLLNPARFVRVHRSHIVNLDYVVAFTPDAKGGLEVELRSGTRLSVSRARAQAVRNLVL